MQTASPEHWFSVTHLSDGVSLISEPFIKAFYRCNVWHVKGRDANMLVDSGMGVVDLRRHITVLSGKHTLAVASHTHFDHIGGSPRIQRTAGAQKRSGNPDIRPTGAKRWPTPMLRTIFLPGCRPLPTCLRNYEGKISPRYPACSMIATSSNSEIDILK